MAIGLYKQGQGYWVRMMTAVAAGVLVLACAAWIWQSVARITPPAAGQSIRVQQPQGVPPPAGATVELLASGDAEPLATAVVRSTTEDAGSVVLSLTRVERTAFAERASREVADTRLARGPGFSGSVLPGGITAIPAFEITYLQAAAAGVVILAGAVVIYMIVGTRPRTVDFLVATDTEARKVNWSTRKEVIGSTWVVIAAMFLIAGTLFVIDLVFQGIFTAIKVLER